jgi:hypothetical protein
VSNKQNGKFGFAEVVLGYPFVMVVCLSFLACHRLSDASAPAGPAFVRYSSGTGEETALFPALETPILLGSRYRLGRVRPLLHRVFIYYRAL